MGRLSTTEGLSQWYKSHAGFMHEAVEFAEDTSKGIFLRVNPRSAGIDPETVVLKCPFAVSMSVLNALNIPPFQAHSLQQLPQTFLETADDRSILAYFIMQQYLLKDESFWAPYIRSLPQLFDKGAFDTPLWWGEEDLGWLNGTSLASTVKTMKDALRNQWTALNETGLFPQEYSWELFKWATEVVDSRSFTSIVLKDAIAGNARLEAAVSTREAFDVMLPMIDALNHRGMARVEWLYKAKSFEWITSSGLAPGDEVFNNYGPRSNDELLLRYGFCSPDNPFDRLFMKVEGSDLSMPQSQNQRFYVRSLDFFESGYEDPAYQYKIPGLRQFPDQLIRLLAPSAANYHERRTAKMRHHTLLVETGSRTILATTAELATILRAHRTALEIANDELPSSPTNNRQSNGKTYRDGQLLILHTALASMKTELFKAIVQDSGIQFTPEVLCQGQPSRPKPTLLRLKTAMKLLEADDPRAHKALITALKHCCGTSNVKKLRQAGWEDVVWPLVLAAILHESSSAEPASEDASEAGIFETPSSRTGNGIETTSWTRACVQFRSFLHSYYGTEALLQNGTSFLSYMQASEARNPFPWEDLNHIKNAAVQADPSSLFATVSGSRDLSDHLWQGCMAYAEESVRVPLDVSEDSGRDAEETLM